MKKSLKELLPYIIILIVVILIKIFIVSPILVNGTSMYPTLHNKDLMILNKYKYRMQKIKRFDIVVVDYAESEYLIKRVIGLPGEVIEYKNNILYVNGKEVKENFKHKNTADFSLEYLNVKKIPKDSYLVMGDNRTNSLDGRVLGFISKEEIMGSANLTLFPFNRIGMKK